MMSILNKNKKRLEPKTEGNPIENPFNIIEKKFIKRATDKLELFGLSWDYIGDYVTALKHSQLRDKIAEMPAPHVHAIAIADDVKVEEGVANAEELVDVIQFVYAEHEATSPIELKRFILSEIKADMEAAGDWKTALQFLAFIDDMPIGYDWDAFTPEDFEEWRGNKIEYDTIADGYFAIFQIMGTYHIRTGLNKVRKPLPLEVTPLNESGVPTITPETESDTLK